MTVALACDHAGFRLKEAVKKYMEETGVAVCDLGVHTPDPVDYPDQALLAAEAVAGGRCELGILICGTGLGMAITANKVPGIRAAVCHDTFSARMAREHNDCNVLAMGERVVGTGLALEVVAAFLGAKYLGERHARRVAKITALEERHTNRAGPGRD
ncbi:MAG: ribose 5-phosphate isomerase B [Patescibacteria group bacterium]